MRRALIQAPGEAALDEVPAPAGEAGRYLISIRACALCTWEQRVFRGLGERYPFAAGHEVGGVVAEGPEGGLRVGTVVAVSLLPRCGECPPCRSGLDNLCAYLTGGGVGEGPGGLAERLLVDPADVAPLSAGRTAVEACLVEPLACVLNSLQVAGVREGSRLAVIGSGFMGILHVRAAVARGAEVTLFDSGPKPLGLERAWEGPSESLEADPWLSSRTPSAEDRDFDAAIVIRGLPAGLLAAAHLVRPGGVVSLYASRPRSEDIALPGQLVRRKQLNLTGAASHRAVDFAAAAAAVGTGTVAVADLVHRTYPFEQVQDALVYAASSDSGRVVVTLDEDLAVGDDDAGR